MEQQEEQRRRQYDAEMARLEREAKEREEQRRRDEHKEIQRKVAKERLEQLKNTAVGAKAFADLSDDVSITPHSLNPVKDLSNCIIWSLCLIAIIYALFFFLATSTIGQ